jgi:hypothetical protein
MSKAMVMAELESSKRQEKSQLREIKEKTELLRQLPVIRSGLNELQSKKDNESQIYNQLVTLYGQSEVSKQMEIENKHDIPHHRPGRAAEDSVSPNRPLIMLASLLAAWGRARPDRRALHDGRRVRSVADLRVFNQRVLAILPMIPKPARNCGAASPIGFFWRVRWPTFPYCWCWGFSRRCARRMWRFHCPVFLGLPKAIRQQRAAGEESGRVGTVDMYRKWNGR